MEYPPSSGLARVLKVPAAQAWQVTAPVTLEIVPGEHGVHAALHETHASCEPILLEDSGASKSRGAGAPDCPDVATALPMAQSTQPVAPKPCCTRPAGQLMQTVAPQAVPYVPERPVWECHP